MGDPNPEKPRQPGPKLSHAQIDALAGAIERRLKVNGVAVIDAPALASWCRGPVRGVMDLVCKGRGWAYAADSTNSRVAVWSKNTDVIVPI